MSAQEDHSDDEKAKGSFLSPNTLSNLQDHRRHRSMRRNSQGAGQNTTASSMPATSEPTDPRGSPANRTRSRSSFRVSMTPTMRPRGMSRSSIRSDAISFRSRLDPETQRARSRSRSRSRVSRSAGNADDSDVESTESMGETDEDVCFPMEDDETHSEGAADAFNVKVDELDRLLNLSSDEEGEHSRQTESRPARATAPLLPGTMPLRSPIIEGDISPDVPGAGATSDSSDSSKRSKGSGKLKEASIESRFAGLPSPMLAPDVQSIARSQFDEGYENDEDEASQRYSFFSANRDSTIHSSDLASLVENGESFSTLFNKDQGVWWLDCYCPTDLEMRVLQRAFGIHPLTAEDIRTEESREKVEMFKKYYLVVYHTFESDPKEETYMEPINFYIIVFPDGVMSFHFSPVTHSANVRRRMRQLRDYVTVSSDWICYALMDDITDSFAPVIQRIEHEADYVEDFVYLDLGHDLTGTNGAAQLLARLGEGRKQTMIMLRLLSGKADVVRMLAKRCTDTQHMPGTDMALYLGDIQDHLVTMYQNLTAYEKIFSRTHFNYMGILQMEFVDASNRTTTVLGKVTIIGTVLLPMNLITGLFGMNVKIPGQDGSNLGWFFGILGFILVLSVVLGLGCGWYFYTAQKPAGSEAFTEESAAIRRVRTANRELDDAQSIHSRRP